MITSSPAAQTPLPVDENGFVFPEPIIVQNTSTGEYYNTLLRGMTHKLNNFLAVIQGFSSLILMTDGLDSGVKENLDHMKEATQGAGLMGERMLSCSGNVRLTPQVMNLREYLPLIEPNLRSLFTKLNVPLQVTISPDTPSVSVDNGRFKEILCELLNNAAEAVQASGKAGAAALDVLPPGQAPGSRPGHVDIFIRNTSVPIAPEKYRDIFKPFFSTKDSKHYGMGLTIVQMLCAQMGIRFGMKYDAETVTVWLSVPVA